MNDLFETKLFLIQGRGAKLNVGTGKILVNNSLWFKKAGNGLNRTKIFFSNSSNVFS